MGDFDLLRLFSLKIEDGITDHLLMRIQYISQCDLDTLHRMKKRLEELSELMAESYDCCVKSCVAFTGPHSQLKACPRCRKPRYRLNGQPMKVYRYIPIIPQLVAFFLNRELNERMRYRSEGHLKANADKQGHMTDVFDRSHYHGLLEKEVTIMAMAWATPTFQTHVTLLSVLRQTVSTPGDNRNPLSGPSSSTTSICLRRSASTTTTLYALAKFLARKSRRTWTLSSILLSRSF